MSGIGPIGGVNPQLAMMQAMATLDEVSEAERRAVRAERDVQREMHQDRIAAMREAADERFAAGILEGYGQMVSGLSQIRAGELKLQGNEGLADQVSGRGQVYAAGVGMVATYFRRSAEQSDATAANYQQLASEAQARADDAREAAERAERRRDRIVSLYEDMQRLTHETRIAQIKG